MTLITLEVGTMITHILLMRKVRQITFPVSSIGFSPHDHRQAHQNHHVAYQLTLAYIASPVRQTKLLRRSGILCLWDNLPVHCEDVSLPRCLLIGL